MKPGLALLCGLLMATASFAQEKPDKRRAAIDKGLAWLVKQQGKDGSWKTAAGWPAASTAFAGLALLADGNTLDHGKYSPQVRKAFDWYRKHAVQDGKYKGLLADPKLPGSTGRYMPEHGMALSFLAQLYGEEEKAEDRAASRKLLDAAVAFSVAGQCSSGGWFYTSTIEGHDSNENAATLVQLQGLMNARNAGIAVPIQALKRCKVHLQRCTTVEGGISYSGSRNQKEPPLAGSRPTFTAMALGLFLPRGGPYDDEFARRWLAYSMTEPAFRPEGLKRPLHNSNELLLHYHYIKAVYHLNDAAWQKANPGKKFPEHLKWTNYRRTLFDRLLRDQGDDGAWDKEGWGMGPVIQTSLALNILLYEDSIAPAINR
jgi:hypothetical protein